MATVPNAKEILSKKNIRPSIVRIKVLEYLLEKRSHPSADEIFKDLQIEMPTLSKTSIYNALNLFVAEGIAKQIDIDPSQIHYDAYTFLHGHFKCDGCNKIFDFQITSLEDNLKGFSVLKKEVCYFGLCKDCLSCK